MTKPQTDKPGQSRGVQGAGAVPTEPEQELRARQCLRAGGRCRPGRRCLLAPTPSLTACPRSHVPAAGLPWHGTCTGKALSGRSWAPSPACARAGRGRGHGPPRLC